MTDAKRSDYSAQDKGPGNSPDPTTPSNPTGNANASNPPKPATPTYPTGAGDKTKTQPPASS